MTEEWLLFILFLLLWIGSVVYNWFSDEAWDIVAIIALLAIFSLAGSNT